MDTPKVGLCRLPDYADRGGEGAAQQGKARVVLGIIRACKLVASPSGWVSRPFQTGEDHEHEGIGLSANEWAFSAVGGCLSRRVGPDGLYGVIDTRRCCGDGPLGQGG